MALKKLKCTIESKVRTIAAVLSADAFDGHAYPSLGVHVHPDMCADGSVACAAQSDTFVAVARSHERQMVARCLAAEPRNGGQMKLTRGCPVSAGVMPKGFYGAAPVAICIE